MPLLGLPNRASLLVFSGEELELRLYTELSPGLSTTEELVGYNDYWNCNTSYSQQTSCLY